MRSVSRRQFLQGAGAGALTLLTSKKSDAANFIARRFLSLPPKNVPFITPNPEFYIVQCCGVQRIDVQTWSLTVTGRVQTPRSWTYSDILKMPSIEKMVTLQCIDNEVSGELISNAVWKGVPLAHLLRDVLPSDSVSDVVLRGADDYSDSITLDRAVNYDVFLAYQMNGMPLPPEHGFPLRAVVPGIYGIKNVKWLTRIELYEEDYKGYWQQKGWTDEGAIKVKSVIYAPGPYNTVRGSYTIRGMAFSGYSGIRSVEVTVDGGKTWRPAKLQPTPSPYAWVFWEYFWKDPKPGAYTLAVRAMDKIGRKQTDFIARPFPEGTSGYHSIVAFVE